MEGSLPSEIRLSSSYSLSGLSSSGYPKILTKREFFGDTPGGAPHSVAQRKNYRFETNKQRLNLVFTILGIIPVHQRPFFCSPTESLLLRAQSLSSSLLDIARIPLLCLLYYYQHKHISEHSLRLNGPS